MYNFIFQPYFYFPKEYWPLSKERINPGEPICISIKEVVLRSLLLTKRDIASVKELTLLNSTLNFCELISVKEEVNIISILLKKEIISTENKPCK